MQRQCRVGVMLCCAGRFAQFFISPLISADGVEREVKAVDSEVRGRRNVQQLLAAAG